MKTKAVFTLLLLALLLALVALATPTPTHAAHSAASPAPAMCAAESASLRLADALAAPGRPSRACAAEKRQMIAACNPRFAIGRELPRSCWSARAGFWQCTDETGGGR